MNPDGSSVARVTTNIGVSDGSRPAWSPDSARLIFGCEIEAGNQDLCAINGDGSGFVQLTDDPAYDSEPAWSRDGSTIVFVSTRWTGNYELSMMRPDGSGITRLGGGIIGARHGLDVLLLKVVDDRLERGDVGVNVANNRYRCADRHDSEVESLRSAAVSDEPSCEIRGWAT